MVGEEEVSQASFKFARMEWCETEVVEQVITQFEISLETGLRLNKVTRLAEDIALNLRVPSVRMVAPIPGKNTVGVEIPNELRATVRLKEVMQVAGRKLDTMKIPLIL
ncbi:MAG: hypothetical protein EBZ00_05920, partial [Actinobacteria bacterium]|nr:hypothetical protein [Actinomycetota bacterium]